MEDFKIALYHCPKTTTYQLKKVMGKLDQNDPCLLWAFDYSKMKLAQKIVKNLNIAGSANEVTGLVFN